MKRSANQFFQNWIQDQLKNVTPDNKVLLSTTLASLRDIKLDYRLIVVQASNQSVETEEFFIRLKVLATCKVQKMKSLIQLLKL